MKSNILSERKKNLYSGSVNENQQKRIIKIWYYKLANKRYKLINFYNQIYNIDWKWLNYVKVIKPTFV